MTRIPSILIALALPLAAVAQDTEAAATAAAVPAEVVVMPAGDSELGDFLWTHRPVVVFADSPEDPRFAEQMDLLTQDIGPLIERDVIVLTDTDPAARSPIRMKLRPRGFMLVLVAKDGTVELRKPLPWTVRELTRSIDKMPIRQREIEDRRGGQG